MDWGVEKRLIYLYAITNSLYLIKVKNFTKNCSKTYRRQFSLEIYSFTYVSAYC